MRKKSKLLIKVYEKVHGLKVKKNYSEPKIYHGGESFDIEKDWYLYYSFRNPETGLLERQPNIKRGNYLKTKTARLQVLNTYRKALSELLEEGYSPYSYDVEENNKTESIEHALNFAFNHKKQSWSETNIKASHSRLEVFKRFLKKKRLIDRPPENITKKVVNEFLDEILQTSSVINRNNYRSNLSPLFSFLVSRELISENYFLKAEKIKSKPKGVKVYSKVLQNDIIDWLKINDPLLLQFVQIFSFGMIRPIEAVRLRVKDFNFEEGYFYVNSKQKTSKKKIIPKIMSDILPDLNGANPEDFIITKDGVGQWNRSDLGKRDYFSKRFIEAREAMKFDNSLKMYNFRHTIISELFVQLIKEHGKNKAFELLMEITGHSTERALKHYLKTLDANLPKDFSKYIE